MSVESYVSDVVLSSLHGMRPLDGVGRIACLTGRMLGLGLLGSLHLAWRAGAATLGIAGAMALVASLPQILAEPDFAVSPAQAATVMQLPLRTSADSSMNWQVVSRPMAVFGLESPELERLTPTYEARRAQGGTERDDTLRFGKFTETAAHLHLSARRSGEPSAALTHFFVDVSREASRHDLAVERSTVPVGLATKFGVIETADAILSDLHSQRACIAFRHVSPLQPLRLSGWWCGTAARPADRGQLACLIDRLDLLSAGDDKPLRQLFAQAELNRKAGCAVSRLAQSGRKASWLDGDGKAPELKKAAVQSKPNKSAASRAARADRTRS